VEVWRREIVTHSLSLDGWLFPLKFNNEADEEGGSKGEEGARREGRELLFLNSDLWQWKENLERMKRVAKEEGLLGAVRAFYIKGTGHHSFAEVSLWTSPMISQLWLHLGQTSVERTIRCCCAVTWELLQEGSGANVTHLTSEYPEVQSGLHREFV
jgi:hypothetical protein